ncbi:MAG: hypothetical protein RIR88_166 [Actinomycetota bacterium]
MPSKIESLEDYLATLDAVRAGTVQRIVDAIVAEYPAATVKIAWNVPQMQIDGEYVFGIAAAKAHLTLASWNPDNLPLFADRLQGYVMNERTFRVPVDWQPDQALLRDIIADRLAQLAAKK